MDKNGVIGMPRFNKVNQTTGKKRSDQIGVVVGYELKRKLELLSKHHNRTLSDFCRLELSKIVNKKEYIEILNMIDNEQDNDR
ncbi:MAG TPA: hypothetical protein DEG71_02835 [Clostridiales bacterium]|nr:hypothetical protein [Clostridiales bacterium]